MLLAEKVIVPAEYLDFADVLFENSANIFPEQTRVNEYAMKLEKSKQPSYEPIYSLKLIELETFKIYIKTNLVNSFIKALKLLANALILFVCKPDGSFCLCINYRGLNNLKIKNRYALPLIGNSLHWLGWVKQSI